MNAKRLTSLILALALLFCAAVSCAVSADAETVYEQRLYENLKKESAVYYGFVLDAETGSTVEYIYSDDVTNSRALYDNLTQAFNEPYSQLVTLAASESPDCGLAASTAHREDMNGDWKNAENVARTYFGDNITSSATVAWQEYDGSLPEYDTLINGSVDKEYLIAERIAAENSCEMFVEYDGRVISRIASSEDESVWYTNENGENVKHVLNAVNIDAEATELICTFAVVNGTAEDSDTETDSDVLYNTELLVSESTLYLGEIYLNGELAAEYVYSDDMTVSPIPSPGVLEKLCSVFNGTGWGGLIHGYVYDAPTEYPAGKGIALATAHADMMNESWKTAEGAAATFINGEVTDAASENMYDINESFRAAVDTVDEARRNVAQRVPAEKRLLFTVSEKETAVYSHTEIFYGREVKRYNFITCYELEGVTVIHTAAYITGEEILFDSDTETDTENTVVTETDTENTDITDTDTENTDVTDTDTDNTDVTDTDTENTDVTDTDTDNTDVTENDTENTDVTDIDTDNTDVTDIDTDNTDVTDTDTENTDVTENDTEDTADTASDDSETDTDDSETDTENTDVTETDTEDTADTASDDSNTDSENSDSDDSDTDEPPVEALLGDCDGDFVITSADALLILRMSVTDEGDPLMRALADVNGDKTADSTDAVLVLRFGVGLADEGIPVGQRVFIKKNNE